MITEALAPKKSWRRWVFPLILALIGILATILVGWYQSVRNEQQAIQAEEERVKNIKSNLISIVEEHVINENPLNISRLTRLIDLRTSEERVNSPIKVMEILERAEFNILNSRYLDFQQKEKYCKVFDEIYQVLQTSEFEPYEKGRHVNLVNDLAKSIQDGQSPEALEKLKRLVDTFNREMDDLERRVTEKKDVGKVIVSMFKDPTLLISVTGSYIALVIVLFYWRRRRLEKVSEKGGKRET